IAGLEVVDDDYLAKTVEVSVLLARFRSELRRYRRSPALPAPAGAAIPLGRFRLDLQSRRLLDEHSREIELTAMEFDLLQTFAQRPNRPLTRDQLLNLTQNRDWNPFDRSIDIRIARLRRKLEDDPEKPQIIRT